MIESEKFVCGVKKNKKDNRDFKVSGIRQQMIVPDKHFDFVDNYPVKYQGRLGSCSSQAGTHHKERQEGITGSARFGMTISKMIEGNEKEWGYTRNIMKAYNKYGMCEESLYPEPKNSVSWLVYIDKELLTKSMYKNAKTHKSKSYWDISRSIDSLRRELFEGKKENRTIALAIKWYKVFNNSYVGKAGVLPMKLKGYAGGHLVELLDYDDYLKRFKCKNSYSSAYGDNGCFYIPYDLLSKIFLNAMTSLDYEKVLAVDNRYGETRTWNSFLREQAMAFNSWLFAKINRLPNNREISALAYGFYPYEAVFRGSVGDAWLHKTYPQYLKEKGLNK